MGEFVFFVLKITIQSINLVRKSHHKSRSIRIEKEPKIFFKVREIFSRNVSKIYLFSVVIILLVFAR